MYLQRDGHAVTVFDPERPGSMTSYGNAGLIATYSTLPTATPGILMKVPKMLMDPAGPSQPALDVFAAIDALVALACP